MVESTMASGTTAKSMVSVFLSTPKISISWVNTTRARNKETGSVKHHLLKNNRITSKEKVKNIEEGSRGDLMSSKRTIISTPDEFIPTP